MNKKSSFFILILSLFLLTNSCQNGYEYSYLIPETENPISETGGNNTSAGTGGTGGNSATNGPQAPVKKYATLNGSLGLSGAYPQTVRDDIEDNTILNKNGNPEDADPARSARPSLPTGSEYYVRATATNHEPVDGVVNQTNRTFQVGPLELDVTWSIEAGIKGRYSNAEEVRVLMNDVIPDLTLTEESASYEHNFLLRPLSTGGNGEINLSMTVPDTVTSASAVCISDDDETIAYWNSLTPTVVVSGTTASLNLPAIKSGSYDIILYFYGDSTDFPVYTTVQSVNVFENMKTNTWADTGNTGVISGGSFEITPAILTQFSVTNIYVGNPGTYGEGLTGERPDDDNTGGPYSPLETLNGAIALIKAQKIADNSYTIHICGQHTGHFELDSGLIKTGTDANATKITIVGQPVTGDDGTTISPVLNGGGDGRVLKVSTGVPVEIKNLSITNGNAADGAGLYVSAGANVTIAEGASIAGNHASANGGGVYVAATGTVNMSAGSISANTAVNGGAVYNAGDFNISANASIPYGTANDVFLPDGKTLTIAGNIASGSQPVATITPEYWTRGNAVLDAASDTMIANNAGRFATIDSDFHINQSSLSGQLNTGILNADIYVASAGSTDAARHKCVASDSFSAAEARGTGARPFATVAQAADVMTNSNLDYTIIIDGNVLGAQEIPSTVQAKTISLQGYIDTANGATTSDAVLNGNQEGSTLTLQAAKVHTIENLKITGGQATSNSNANGGGINVASSNARLNLGNGVLIKGNTANNGGGVYIIRGAGLCIYGSAVIGDSSAENPSTSATATTNINTAVSGGGINCAGKLYLGYKYDSEGVAQTSSSTELTGGIFGNYASTSGGGVYLDSTGTAPYPSAQFTTGLIKCNGTGQTGGGVFVGYNASLDITDSATVSFDKNKAFVTTSNDSNGGAIFLAGSARYLDIQGGTFTANEAESNGGAICANSNNIRLSRAANLYTSSNTEKVNDICLLGTSYVAITGNLSQDNVATITPETWTRGTKVITASSQSLRDVNLSKFTFTDTDFEVRAKTVSSDYQGIVYAPIIVKTTSVAVADQIGTASKPYSTIKKAVNDAVTAEFNEVTVVGTVYGAQEVSGTVASDFTIMGQDSNATLSLSSSTTTEGTVLTVNASGKTVTIQDLKITGGNAAATSDGGGGICISAGSVCLADGAVVKGNRAKTYGGGVYIGSAGKLFMHGSSVIGDVANSTGLPSYANTAIPVGNEAKLNGGAIYNNGGEVLIGYDATGFAASVTSNYGIRKNYSVAMGAAIYNASGKIKINSVDISYNLAGTHGGGLYVSSLGDGSTLGAVRMSDNKATQDGGAIYIASGKTLEVSGSAIFTKNTAKNGGAIYNAGTFSLGAGRIGGTTSANTASTYKNTASTGLGGAIYNKGTLYLNASSICFYGGAVNENDIYLDGTNKVTLKGSPTSHSETNPICLTMPSDGWTRGKQVLAKTTDLTGGIDSTVVAKFRTIDDDFTVMAKDAATGVLKAPIYVAGTGHSSLRQDAPSTVSEQRGSSSKPFSTIASAAAATGTGCTEIIVDGTLSEAQTIETCGSNTITLSGYKTSNTATSTASLTGNTTYGNTMLTVNNSSLTLTITDLTIKNGWNSNGGGIAVNSGTVKLGDKVKVTGNIGTNGGGVYVKSGAILFVYGSARIGDEGAGIATSSSTTDNSTTGCSNSAAKGGGIYNAGTTYIGYSAAGGSTVTTTGGVYRNFANSMGGGIYNPGVLIFGNGYIKYNATDNQGGAVYNDGSFTLAASASIPDGGGERKNDIGLLYDSSTGDFNYLTVDSTYTGTNAVITPTQWKRGKKVVDGTYDKCALFSTTDSDFSVTHTTTDYGNLSAPIIVATNNSSPYIAQATRGTTSDPYKTISDAVTNAVDSSNKKITIKGTVPAQSISSWPTTGGAASVAELTIEGADANATINGGGTSSALAINTAKTFNISSLKITNGKAASGGGIYIQSEGTVVNLDSGAKVYSNKATTSGGGVYVASSAKLIIKTGAAIYSNAPYSDSGTIDGGGVYNLGTVNMTGGSIYSNATRTSTGYGNGGGIYNNGTLYVSGASNIYSNTAYYGGGIDNRSVLYLGPSATDSTATMTGAIYKNTASEAGGGIYSQGTSVEMTTGTIGGSAANKNTALQGGGIFLRLGAFTMSGGTVSYNEATTTAPSSIADSNGGGIWFGTSNNLTLSGGTISNNTAANFGDGIYHCAAGNFNVKLDAQVDTTNDVYLANSSATVKIAANNLSKSTVAKLTPSTWNRGRAVISASNNSYLTDANLGRFVLSDSEWSIESYAKTVSVTTTTSGVLNAPVYVASTAATDTNRASDISAAPATATDRRGTKTAPYATITEAVAECNWDVSSTKTKDFTINVSGSINVSDTQSISSDITNAKSITIEGVAGNTKDVINRGLTAAPSSGYGSVIVIDTAVPLIFKKLKITGGYAKTNGGGIFCQKQSAKLTLSEGALISGNTAKEYGGGVYFSGVTGINGRFIMESDAKIDENEALQFGGGVYLKFGNLAMSGSAIVGRSTSTNDYAQDANMGSNNLLRSNKASRGGGIFCEDGGKLWLGYTYDTDSNSFVEASSFSGGVMYNYANVYGGGIYATYTGIVNMAKGKITKNATKAASGFYGGGVAMTEGGTFNMTGGNISYNYSGAGGGVWMQHDTDTTTFDMSGTASIDHNSCSTSAGGAMHIASANVVFKIGGGASIPSDTSAATDNVIYITNQGSNCTLITLTSNLTTTNKIKVSYRTPANIAGSAVLEAAGGTIANNYKKFEVLPASGSLWAITNTGTLQKTGISVTAANATSKISDLTTGMTLQITTQPTTSQYGDIRDALRSLSGVSGITLDLSTIDSLSLTGPSSTTGVFANCACLKVVVLGYGLAEIGANAFYACSNLEEVTIPASVTKIGANAFKNTSLYYAVFKDPVEWKVDGTALDPGNLTNSRTAADCLTIDYVNSLWTK